MRGSGGNQQGHLYLGTFTQGIFCSTDKGKSWQQINNGLGNLTIQSIAFDSRGRIIAATISGLFYSDDDGENWASLTDGPTPRAASETIIDKNGHIWVGGMMITRKPKPSLRDYRGLYYSTDHGKTWVKTDYDFDGKEVEALAINSRGDLFAGTFEAGLHRFTNDKSRWARVGKNIESVRKIVIDYEDIVYALTYQGILRSVDNGFHFPIF